MLRVAFQSRRPNCHTCDTHQLRLVPAVATGRAGWARSTDQAKTSMPGTAIYPFKAALTAKQISDMRGTSRYRCDKNLQSLMVIPKSRLSWHNMTKTGTTPKETRLMKSFRTAGSRIMYLSYYHLPKSPKPPSATIF